MSAPNRPRPDHVSSVAEGARVETGPGRRGVSKPRSEWTPLELARAVTLSRRTAHSDITAEELELLEELIAGRISITAAGVGLGVPYANASAAVARCALRAVLAGYYVRSDKEAPK